ncbi:unnamed protein product [Phytophthora lilii]|uniref:Unnamed protein product n=1 Tax=Phytophthora lilii TaxID=2077276 RepID=A0A9W6U1E6_9STRA|nr:unnamed protein product [Phytophthora lilii]
METNVVGLSLRASEGTVQGKRHLRTDQKADGNLNEERATVTLGTKLYDKVATTKWLEGLLEKGESLKKVKEQYLKISSTLPKEKMVFHPNWNAYAKYERMHFKKATGKKVAYAYFGSIPQSEKNTEEVLQGWIIAGRSDESVGKYLGVWGLPPSEQVLHVNWRAFKKYKKWHAQ